MYYSVLSQHFEKIPPFLLVARLGSFSKAAQALAISQAALSQSMKKLEDVLEIKLFIRSRSGIKLTTQGKVLFDKARKIIEEVELLETRIKKDDHQDLRRIQIGTHEALATHFWPHVILPFQSKHPQYILSMISGRVHQIIQQVLKGDLDLALTVRPHTLSGIKTEVLYEDDFEFYIARPKSVKPFKMRYRQEDLSKIFILTDSHAHLSQGRSVAQALGELGLSSSHHFELNSFEAAARLAEKGVGIALLPKRIVEGQQPKFQLHKIVLMGRPKEVFRHQICLSYRGDQAAEIRINSIIEFLKKVS